MLKINWYKLGYWIAAITYPIRAIRITSLDTLIRGEECEAVCERLRRMNNGSLRDHEFFLGHIRDYLWARDDKPIPEYKQGNGPMSLDVLRMRINSEFRDKFKEHRDSMYALEIKNQKLEYENQTLRNAILIVSPQTPDKDHHQ